MTMMDGATQPGGMNLFGVDLFGEPIAAKSRGKIADDFVCPPFTVLSSREGWWQERKRAWIGVGIEGELGRDAKSYQVHEWTKDRVESGLCSKTIGNGTSLFDPVLTELCYKWFSPPAATILDPFAGGSVRGIVAGMLGRHYHGIELRPEQVAANVIQADAISPEPRPTWVAGDSIDHLPASPMADLIFSCPPYYDLEKYSDDPRDLSAMPWDQFLSAYRRIIALSADRLRPDRFACFVVGDVRDKAGNYRNLPGETIRAFQDAGLTLYNEAILVTPVGSLPIRINSQFTASRKLGKTHQSILVFLKGDARRATAACGVVAGA